MEGLISHKKAHKQTFSFYHYLVSTLIWHNPFPLWFELSIKIFSELQTVTLLMNHVFDSFQGESTDPFIKILQDLTKFFSATTSLTFSKGDLLGKIATIIICCYTIFTILLMALLLISFRKPTNKTTRLQNLWTSTGIIHYNVFFLWIQTFSLSLLKTFINQDDGNVKSTSSLFISK